MLALLTAVALAQAPAPVNDKPLGFTLIPPSAELPPVAKTVECGSDMLAFDPDPVPFEKDVLVPYEDEDGSKQQWRLRPGILLSECGFVQMINTRIEHKRYKLELKILKDLWETKERGWDKAETNYQETIVKLQDDLREANSPSFWEEYDGPIMFGLGIVAAGLVVAGAVGVMDALNNARVTATP